MTAADLRTDDAHFLARIIADPDSDAERLIYADWLEEQGREERAEFVRAQVVLDTCPLCARIQGRGCVNHERLRRRERELLDAADEGDELPHRVRWIGVPEPSYLLHDEIWPVYRRGFVEAVTLPAAAWLSHGPALARAAPLRRVRWSDCEVVRYGTLRPAVEVLYGLAVPGDLRTRIPRDLRRAVGVFWPTRQGGEDAVSAAAIAWANDQPA